MENSIIIPENISLFHLEVLQANIVDLPAPKNNSYSISIAHTTMHNLAEQRIKIGLAINIEGSKKKIEQNPRVNFHIDFHFEIKDLINFYKLNEKGEPLFSGLLIATLLGISFSTARGIIYERLSNTNLKNIILPVISPQKMLETKVQPV